MPAALRITRWALAALAVALLAGCALPRRIDSEVQSFTGATAAVTPASYRFERLPSQEDSPAHDALENMARTALARVGLHAVPAGAEADARYALQLQMRISAIPSPYLGSSAIDGLWGRRRPAHGVWLDMQWEPPWSRHAVSLVLRDIASAQVVYETRAHFDGPWGDSANLLPAVLEAALQGYPKPPLGPRKVVIDLPAPTASSANQEP